MCGLHVNSALAALESSGCCRARDGRPDAYRRRRDHHRHRLRASLAAVRGVLAAATNRCHVGDIWDGIAKQARPRDDLATRDHPPSPTLTAVYWAALGTLFAVIASLIVSGWLARPGQWWTLALGELTAITLGMIARRLKHVRPPPVPRPRVDSCIRVRTARRLDRTCWWVRTATHLRACPCVCHPSRTRRRRVLAMRC